MKPTPSWTRRAANGRAREGHGHDTGRNLLLGVVALVWHVSPGPGLQEYEDGACTKDVVPVVAPADAGDLPVSAWKRGRAQDQRIFLAVACDQRLI